MLSYFLSVANTCSAFNTESENNNLHKMFYKKKFKLVENKNNKSSAKNKWIRYVVILGLIGFVLLIILANVKSKSYYQNLKVPKIEIEAKKSSLLALSNDITARETEYSCSNFGCSVICSGDMSDLKGYLNKQKTCNSMTLTISNYFFPNDRLESNWVVGSFNLSIIRIRGVGTLKGIANGAFDHKTVKYVTELELSDVEIQSLTTNTFSGLLSLKTFTLISKVDTFVGDSFLKPMEKTLEKIQIKIETPNTLDPKPWLRGDFIRLITIVFDGSNFGSNIKNDTFQHLSKLSILKMDACKIDTLPNGVFNFMMSQMVVLISLERNQLQTVSGNFLKEVSPLKRISLSFNPWNCSCELFELINEYQRYPDGFGTDVKCSFPLNVADQNIGDINVESCEHTTSTISTTSTTEQSTSSTIISNSSSSFSSETLMPTSSTEWSEANTSTEMSITSFSTEVSDQDLGDSTSATPFGSTDFGTTITVPQTTPSPQNRTTTLSANAIFIECQRYKQNSDDTVDVIIELAPPLTTFTINYLSATSVKLTLEEEIEDLALIWFYDQPHLNGTGKDIRISGEFKVGCQNDVENSLTIEGLSENQAYTFCLVQEGQEVISPFSCISYCTGTSINFDMDTWLKIQDKGLTIGLFTFGILISLFLGSLTTFCIIRAYPILLKGSRRVVVVNRSTGDVLIMPKPDDKKVLNESSFRNSYETNTTIPQRRSSETSIQSGLSYMIANNYEDIEYHWKVNVVNDMIYANRIPKSPPPPLPKRPSETTKLNKDDYNKINISIIDRKGNDYGYIP